MTAYYVHCDGPESAGYCVEVFARGECEARDMCSACLKWTMGSLDVAAGSELPWSLDYQLAAGATSRRTWVSTRRPIDVAREQAAAWSRRLFRRPTGAHRRSS